jgi:hypothetical protein
MYFPKSKIITDRYTNGGELFYKNTGTPYQGYYHILASGEVFSGKSPTDGQVLELVYTTNYNDKTPNELNTFQVSPTSIFKLYDFGTSKLPYDNIRKQNQIEYPPTVLIEPTYIQPTVSYPSFIRYFVKRVNNVLFIEIDQQQYTSLKSKDRSYNWPSYIPFSLPWTTGGASRVDIQQTNRKVVLLTENREGVYGLSQYITNYTEFAI